MTYWFFYSSGQMHFLLKKHAHAHSITHLCTSTHTNASPLIASWQFLVSSGSASVLALISWPFLLCFHGLCFLLVLFFCVFLWVSLFLCWVLPWMSHDPWLCWYLRIGPEALCAWGGLGPLRGRDVGGRTAELPRGWPMVWAELSVEILPVSVSIACFFEVLQIFQSGTLKFSIWEGCASLLKFWKFRERKRKELRVP